jgi:hypothetical protein
MLEMNTEHAKKRAEQVLFWSIVAVLALFALFVALFVLYFFLSGDDFQEIAVTNNSSQVISVRYWTQDYTPISPLSSQWRQKHY